MREYRGILLLLTSLLSLPLLGAVYATGCTPSSLTQMCIATDKTDYAPGATVSITVEMTGDDLQLTNLPTYPIIMSPISGNQASSSVVASTNVTINYVGGMVWEGSVSLVVPGTAPAGNYDLMVLYHPDGNSGAAVGGSVELTVT